MSTKAATSAAVDLAKAINATLGAGTVMMGSDASLEVKFLPTGVLPIDVLMDGGLPRGRFIELYGDFSTLKTWISLKAMATTQAGGGTVAMVDTEHSWDPDWAEALGVDPKAVIVMRPATGEAAINVIEALIRQGVDLVVWDSIAATLPKTEQEKASGEPMQPARLAVLMSRGLAKLTAANTNTAVLCLNQTRINVGILFGSPETTPGGKALGFYASMRVALRKSSKVTEEATTYDGSKNVKVKRTVAQTIRATLEKSKVNRPHQDTYFIFDYRTHDVDELSFMVAWGAEHGLIKQEGTMWEYGSVRARGRAVFQSLLDGDPLTKDQLRAEMLSACRGNQSLDSSKEGSPSESS